MKKGKNKELSGAMVMILMLGLFIVCITTFKIIETEKESTNIINCLTPFAEKFCESNNLTFHDIIYSSHFGWTFGCKENERELANYYFLFTKSELKECNAEAS